MERLTGGPNIRAMGRDGGSCCAGLAAWQVASRTPLPLGRALQMYEAQGQRGPSTAVACFLGCTPNRVRQEIGRLPVVCLSRACRSSCLWLFLWLCL